MEKRLCLRHGKTVKKLGFRPYVFKKQKQRAHLQFPGFTPSEVQRPVIQPPSVPDAQNDATHTASLGAPWTAARLLRQVYLHLLSNVVRETRCRLHLLR